MLADKILRAAASNVPMMKADLEEAAAEIRQAERFSVSDDVRETCRNIIVSRPTTLVEALAYARPPFEKCWFEWNPNPGQRALNTAQIRPQRLGAMVTRMGPDAWSLWTAWHYDVAEAERHARQRYGDEVAGLIRRHDPGLACSGMIVGVDLTKPIAAPSAILDDWILLRGVAGLSDEQLARLRNDETNSVRYAIKDRRERDALESLDRRMGYKCRSLSSLQLSVAQGADGLDAALKDVQEEIAPMMAILILLNSKNCVEVAKVEQSAKLNKARVKRGQLPLLDHSTVHINLSRTQRNVAIARGMSEAEMRRHKVRGHFKLRRTGVFYWHDHHRGSATLGEVQHEYEISV